MMYNGELDGPQIHHVSNQNKALFHCTQSLRVIVRGAMAFVLVGE